MFVKERFTPLPLQKMDAAIRRLPDVHTELSGLQTKVAKAQRGYNGERRLDYHLNILPGNFSILSDVTLTDYGKQFQMDSLIISEQAIFLIEVKNFYGTITFDTTLNQLTRDDGRRLSGYQYPITQVENTQFRLLRWLQKRNLAGLPIYYFIAIAENSTIFKVVGDAGAMKKVVLYVEEIPLRIIKINDYLSQNSVGKNQLKNKIVKEIMSSFVDFDIDILGKFGILKNEILPGVHCLDCGRLAMSRKYGKWHCNYCKSVAHHAHRSALLDYTLLISDFLTNKTCRGFLQIDSRHLAKRLLKNSGYMLKEGTEKWYRNKK